jgi:hypothetical protein
MVERSSNEQLSSLTAEVARLLKKRDAITAELVRSLGLIRALSSLADEGWNKEQYVKDIAARICQPPTIPEAVLLVLRISREPMRPTVIRDCLLEWGYDLRKYTYPMAAIHSALRKLSVEDKILIKQLPDGSKVYLPTSSSPKE